LHSFDPQAAVEEIRGLLGADAVQWGRRAEANEGAFGRRGGPVDVLPDDAAEAKYSGAGRAYEPLDLESINALNIALQKYEGTVLLVTHDHDLIDEVATRIWHFDHGSIEDFQGPIRRVPVCLACGQ
jgi:hypothetical protein